MIVDQRWKFVHAEGGFRPMLFDLDADPDELDDLARRPGHEEIIELMQQRLAAWARRPAQRTTLANDEIIARRGKSRRKGILLGAFDESDVDDELMVRYRGGSSDEAS
jgi:arylsulfatase A-like enzyme